MWSAAAAFNAASFDAALVDRDLAVGGGGVAVISLEVSKVMVHEEL